MMISVDSALLFARKTKKDLMNVWKNRSSSLSSSSPSSTTTTHSDVEGETRVSRAGALMTMMMMMQTCVLLARTTTKL